jgi:hypothetical protein
LGTPTDNAYYLARSSAAGTWQKQKIAPIKSGRETVDTHGTVHVVYDTKTSAYEGEFYDTVFNGKNWSSIVRSGALRSRVQLKLDSQGRPHMICGYEYLYLK